MALLDDCLHNKIYGTPHFLQKLTYITSKGVIQASFEGILSIFIFIRSEKSISNHLILHLRL